jgi:hypothetical protein
VSQRDPHLFMSTLCENVKNMGGVRVKQIDKKIEKRLKDSINT